MIYFELHRDEDVTGVSGIGHIASGVIFPDGTAVTHWLLEPMSTVVWHTTSETEAVETIRRIHGHGGKTRIVSSESLKELRRDQAIRADLNAATGLTTAYREDTP